MWTISLWMFALMLALNGTMAYVGPIVEDQLDVEITSPFDGNTITPIDQPNIYNSTDQSGTLYQNVTSIANATSGNPFNFFTESLYWSLGLLQTIYLFASGAFIFSAISVIGIPTLFLQLAFFSVLGFFVIITIAHLVTGRFG